jgi:two-component system, NarL family, response regulator LiaR
MQQEKPVRILIADDHAMVRSGLAAFLDAFDDLELVGEAADGLEAVKLCDELQPDIVLMDMLMPGMDGPAATRLIHARWPATRVIALTSFGQESLVQGALQAGAISYLLKNVSHDELAQAIRAAHIGRATLAPEAMQALIRVATRLPEPGLDMTPREREVLALMVKGLSNPEIAGRLSVTESTIKSHVSSILSKLEVTSRTEAVSLAIQRHLIEETTGA